MTSQELDLVRHAIELLRRLLPDDQGRAGDSAPPRCPVFLFAQRYLTVETGSDMTTAELWRFYAEVAAAGELDPLSKAEFLRRLPGVMESIFGARKCHSIERGSRRLRGFRGVTIRLDGSPATVPEVTPES